MAVSPALLDRLRDELERHYADDRAPADRVPLNAPIFGADEVMEVLDSLVSTHVTMGDKVRRFERAFADSVGVRHAIMVNSGSSANLLLLSCLANPRICEQHRLRPGDEVVVPAVTWITSLAPVIQVGAVPVIVDADIDTFCMAPDAAEAAISERTKAVFVTNLLGGLADIDRFRALADRHGLVLIEDSCESLGATRGGIPTGGQSLATTFSFYFSHHITTIEGGMIATDDDELADLCRCLRSHGWTRELSDRAAVEASHADIDPRFLFVNVGYNLRPTELQAAFGLHQLAKLEGYNRRRRQLAAEMRRRLSPLSAHLRPAAATPGTEPAWFGFAALVSDASRRRALVDHLERRGIDTRPIICGNLAAQPMLALFDHRIGGPLAAAQAIMDRGIYWACHPSMSEAQVAHIEAAVTAFFQETHD